MVGDIITGSSSSSPAVHPMWWIERKVVQSQFPALSRRLRQKHGRKAAISLLLAQGLLICRSGAENCYSHIVKATTCRFSMSHEAVLQNWHHFS